jgi:hypothetical protein
MAQQRYSDSVIAKFKLDQEDWMKRVLEGSLDPTEVALLVKALIYRGNKDRLTIDYSMTLAEMVNAGGTWDVDWRIKESDLKITGSGLVEVEYKLFRFSSRVSPREACESIDKAGWSLGKIEHLLTYAFIYPDDQRYSPIATLGTWVENDGEGPPYYPSLTSFGETRALQCSSCFGGGRATHEYRVLAIRSA